MSTAQSLQQLVPTPVPVAVCAAMRDVMDAVGDVAATPTTVLLLGESGTGKELLARFIHERSGRTGPWLAVDCAAPVPGVLAAARDLAASPEARHATLFLDEVADLPLAAQAELLRILQGALEYRVIASSSRDLAHLANRGQFRTDLYYRLSVFPIAVPPLRERGEDLESLAAALVEESALGLGRSVPILDGGAVAALRAHRFPGNVRELRNVLERGLVRCRGALLTAAHLRLAPPPDALHVLPARTGAGLPLDLGELERLAIAEALRRVGGNRTHAARLLGIGLRTLRNKLRTYREAGLAIEQAGAADGQNWPTTACFAPTGPARASQEDCS